MIRDWSPEGDFIRFEDPNSKYHRLKKLKDLWYCLNELGIHRGSSLGEELPIRLGKLTIESVDHINTRGNGHITVSFSVKGMEVEGSKLLGGFIIIERKDITTRVYVSCHPEADGAEFEADLSSYTDYVLDSLFDNSETFTKIIPEMRAKDKKINQKREKYKDIVYKFNLESAR